MNDSEWPVPKLELTSRPQTLIGLGGLLRSGKDTAADYLVSEHGFLKVGMSDALNAFLTAQNPVLGLDPSQGVLSRLWHGPRLLRYADAVARYGYVDAKARLGEFRTLMQRTGTEAGRQTLYEDVWVDAVARRVQAATQPVVVTGIRFPNELAMVHRLGGLSVWVHRPSAALGARDAAMGRHPAGKARTHASETSVSPEAFDAYLVNDGTLADLYARTRDLVQGRG